MLFEEHETSSLTDLARSLGVHRSSLSRSMSALKSADLVFKHGGLWALTAQGKEEAQRLQQELPDQISSATKRLVSLSDLASITAESPSSWSTGLSALYSSAFGPGTRLQSGLEAQLSSMSDIYSMAQSLSKPLTRVVAQTDVLMSAKRALDEFSTGGLRSIVTDFEISSMTYGAEAALTGLASTETMLDQLNNSVIRYSSLLLPQDKLLHQFEGIESSLIARTNEAWHENMAGMISAVAGFEEIYRQPFKDALEAISLAALRPSPVELAARSIADKMGDYQALADLNFRLSHEAITAFSVSQQLESAVLSQLSLWREVPNTWMAELGRVGVSLGRTVDDLLRLSLRDCPPGMPALSMTRSLADVVSVGKTHQALMADAISHLDDALRYGQSDLRLALPTDISWAMTSGISQSFVESEYAIEPTDWGVERNKSHWKESLEQVERVLMARAPHLVRKWQGSWEVLESGNPDCVAQGAHSGRELLMQYLAVVAPDDSFTGQGIRSQDYKGQGVTRKMRVRKLLQGASDSKVEWIEAVAIALEKTYERLAAISHDRSNQPTTNPSQVCSLMLVLGGLIVFIENERPCDTVN